jgi:hypothetical protein
MVRRTHPTKDFYPMEGRNHHDPGKRSHEHSD